MVAPCGGWRTEKKKEGKRRQKKSPSLNEDNRGPSRDGSIANGDGSSRPCLAKGTIRSWTTLN